MKIAYKDYACNFMRIVLYLRMRLNALAISVLSFKFIPRKISIAKLLYLFLPLLISSCSPTKYLKKGEYLLKTYEIELDEKDDKAIADFSLESYVRQKPNKQIFSFPIYASIYNVVNPKKEAIREKKRKKKEDKMNRRRQIKGKEPRRKFALSRWLLSIGEKPVVYNNMQTKKSSEQITKFLKNKGYFGATTNSEEKFKSKTVGVKYKVKAGKPHTIRKYIDTIEDPAVAKLLKPYFKNKSKIKTGERVDVAYFEEERDAINTEMLNNGYYRFAKGYIFFQIDTLIGNYQADVKILIKSPTEIDDIGIIQKLPHKKYYLNNLTIYPDHEPKSILESDNKNLITYETVDYKKGISFHVAKKNKFTKAVLTRGLTLEKDSLYRAKNAQNSFAYYSSLSNFRLINFEFKEPKISTNFSDTAKYYLYPHIKLSPSIAQSFTVELEGNITSGRFGAASNFLYRNTNIFGGAEILDVKFKLELNNQEEASAVEKSYFSDTEYGVNTSIKFPNLILPFTTRKFYLKYLPKTSFSLGYNYRNNSSYQRILFSSAMGYTWKSSKNLSHQLNILEFSSVKLKNLNLNYLAQLLNTGQFDEKYDHLILGSSYSVSFNSQKVNKLQNFHYVMFKFEIAGNLINLINNSLKSEKIGYGDYLKHVLKITTETPEEYEQAKNELNNEGSFYKLFKLPYAQYLKTEIDFRYYYILNKNNEVVYRVNPGVIVPYGNSIFSPQEKRFFLGGASSMRAWQARQLGPGSYRDSSGIYQYGDIKLEMNLEYRFNIFWMFDGAIFLDAGNIWSLSRDKISEQKKFNVSKFYKQVAFGTGLGIRMDLDFFVIRFDFGVKLHDPSLPDDKRWLGLDAFKFREMTFNFGIGYPF